MHYFSLLTLLLCFLLAAPSVTMAASHTQKSSISQTQKKHVAVAKKHKKEQRLRQEEHVKKHKLAKQEKKQSIAQKKTKKKYFSESRRAHKSSVAQSTKEKHRLKYRHTRHRHAAQRTRAFLQRKRTTRSWVEEAHAGQLRGKASWYGAPFHGGPTASGIPYNMYTFTAAHRTLPFGTVVKVTTQDSGKSVMVRVTDRGPYIRGRIIDLSYAAANQLGLKDKGIGDVKLEVVSDAQGMPLKKRQAFYVQYKTAHKIAKKAGPYREFSDAAAMQKKLSRRFTEAKVVLLERPRISGR